MSNDSNDTTSSGNFDSTTHYTGRVKWFNNKAGYGFLTVCVSSADDRVNEDIFVHHSGIKVASEQYKYLVQGEYVDFTLRESDSGKHPFQATGLTGVAGGKLMCETRLETRQTRDTDNEGDYRGEDTGDVRTQRRQSRPNGQWGNQQRVRLRGTGPREGETWTLVRDGTDNRSGRNSRHRQNRRTDVDE